MRRFKALEDIDYGFINYEDLEDVIIKKGEILNINDKNDDEYFTIEGRGIKIMENTGCYLEYEYFEEISKSEEILKKLMSSEDSLFFDCPLFEIDEHDEEMTKYHGFKYSLVEQTDGMDKYELTKEEYDYLKKLKGD